MNGIPEFITHDADICERWDTYTDKLESFFQIKEIDTEQKKLHYLLYSAGTEIMKIKERLVPNSNEYSEVKKAIATHFAPKQKQTLNIFNFRAMKQNEQEPFEEYVQRLKDKIKYCEFPNSSFELFHHIILNISNVELQKKVLSNRELKHENLDELIKICILEDNVATSAEAFNSQLQPIYKVKALPTGYQPRRDAIQNHRVRQSNQDDHKNCGNCGKLGNHNNEQPCPARGHNAQIAASLTISLRFAGVSVKIMDHLTISA